MRRLCFWLCIGIAHSLNVTSIEGRCYGEFTAEMRGRELWVGSACKSSCSGSADPTNIPCRHVSGTVSPFIHLNTCLLREASNSVYTGADVADISAVTVVFSASHTLVTPIIKWQNCTTGECYWTLELPEQFLLSPCIDISVADFTTAIPPLRGIRRRIWLQANDQPEMEMMCEGICHILDDDTHDHRVTVALILQDNSYHLLHTSDEANFTVELPRCLQHMGFLQWTGVQTVGCSAQQSSFTPTHVYAVSSTEVFITGDNTILYRSCMLYQLHLTSSERIISFVHISNVFYVLLTANSESGVAGVWVGVVGQSPVLQVYPSIGLEWLWNTTDATPLDPLLASSSLAVDAQGNLVAVSDSGEVQLPLPILISHAFYNHYLNSVTQGNGSTLSTILPSSLHLLANHDIPTLEDRSHPLLHQAQLSHVCRLTDVLIEAPVCSRITRTIVEIERLGPLQAVDVGTLPWINCSVMGDSLPRDVFLRLGESYVFMVQLVINPVIAVEVTVDELALVPTVSRPDTVEILTRGTFHAINSTMSYQVSFVEKNTSSMPTQVPPSTILKSVDIYLQAGGVGMECVDPLDSHLKLLGRLHTSVHVGCPPGLSLMFDDVATQSHDNQYCDPTTNISCYYFGNKFHPVMQLVDSVTGASSTYTGPYTLRVLAGGTSMSRMETFNVGQNIESKIWTVTSDNILSQTNNRIEWVCGLGSPCGEIIPGSGRSPVYYLLLRASNRVVGQHETYCDLTVEFIIRLHGMSMGPITTSVTLILMLVMLVVPLLSLFLVWVWREGRGDEGLGGERWKRLVDKGRGLASRLQQWLEKVAKKYQQTEPLESHLHTD